MNAACHQFAAADRGGCDACPVRPDAICASLLPDELDCLSALGRKRRVERGQRLVWEGDPSTFVANVIEGAFKLSLSTSDGREQIVGVAWPGDFIGRPYGEAAAFSATALADARLCVFGRHDFESFAESHATLTGDMLRRSLSDLDRARSFMLLLARKSAGQRIATLLHEMAQRSRAEAGDRVALSLRRQDIADVLGMTLETVSRQLTRLVAAGVIALPDRSSFTLLRPAMLEAMAA